MKKLTIAAKRTFLLFFVSLAVLSGCGEKGVTQKEPASSSKEPEHDAEKTGETPSFTDEENSASESDSAAESESTPEFTAGTEPESGTESLPNGTEANETVSQKPDDHHLPCTAQFPSGTAVGMWDEKQSQINGDVWWITTDREFEDLMKKYPDANNGSPHLTVSPGWIEACGIDFINYNEDGTIRRFYNYYNHSDHNILEELSNDSCLVLLVEYEFDPYTLTEIGEFNISEEYWLTEYWTVCFIQEKGDIFYSFFFSKKCFSKEEVIEFAKTVVFEEGAFQAK